MRFVLLLLAGCRVTSDDLTSVPLLPAAEPLVAPPPTAESDQEAALYQLLFASELGDDTFALGQRVRVRAWLGSLGLTAIEREGLRTLVIRVRGMARKHAADADAYAARELAALGPVYTELDARLQADPPPSEAELAAFAERLSAARATAHGESPPAAAQYAALRELLSLVTPWLGSLPTLTRERVLDARFFLVRRAHPLGNTGAYNQLVGLDWDGGQFAQLVETEATDPGQLDIGGLWSVEKKRTAPGKYLTLRQQQAIVVMATLDPALGEVLGVPVETITGP